jgi:hypothetical protein
VSLEEDLVERAFAYTGGTRDDYWAAISGEGCCRGRKLVCLTAIGKGLRTWCHCVFSRGWEDSGKVPTES